ncbi:Hypothetical protein SRAE_2000467100 [Strongyloides ratti]|uniref:Uncharacterized protein n=1 Tax=Strongyloides ratti TaxID=34506 RepID=A0A090LPA8_STRRB|nr:Hypothetical protein SRAE_2000467100 [Strongyloides ratti]CEF70029.1 Hypothetical protein SRAE_2000467100 [Strongyloides ratti]
MYPNESYYTDNFTTFINPITEITINNLFEVPQENVDPFEYANELVYFDVDMKTKRDFANSLKECSCKGDVNILFASDLTNVSVKSVVLPNMPGNNQPKPSTSDGKFVTSPPTTPATITEKVTTGKDTTGRGTTGRFTTAKTTTAPRQKFDSSTSRSRVTVRRSGIGYGLMNW